MFFWTSVTNNEHGVRREKTWGLNNVVGWCTLLQAGRGVGLWGRILVSLFCVNRVGCGRVSHTAYCCTTTYQLKISVKFDISLFLISNFRHVLNVVCFLLGNSPASEIYMPTFRNTLSVPSSKAGRCEESTIIIPIRLWRWKKQSVPKGRHIKFRSPGN